MPPLTQLGAVMRADPTLLLDVFREPAVTAYNRLEARPRAHDFTRSLRAEVRDAMWLLTRQWQLGELEAQDAGSPIDARLVTRQLTPDRVSLGAGPAQPYDDATPLEATVERERVPFTHALRVQAAQYFLRLHSPALRAKYRPRYRAAFAFAQDAEADFRGQVDGLNLYLATRRLAFDGGRALDAIRAGTFAADVPVDGTDAGDIQGYVDAFVAWLDRQYTQPPPDAPPVWDVARLCYSLSIAAPAPEGVLRLDAPRYADGRLDWDAFQTADGGLPVPPSDGTPAPRAPTEEVLSFLPTTVTFKGMPNARFWEMEERLVNLGALDAQTTDQLMLVFAELGLVYGNDWYVVPYRLPVNTVCEVLGLVVTDVFGQRTLVRAANERPDQGWQRWSLFDLSAATTGPRRLFLPATLGATLESDPLERVQFLRDEMANMVWAVEDVIPDATGRGIDGHQAADRTGVEPTPVHDSPAAIRYLLGTTVPENWIPFLPARRDVGGQDIAFQRAAMPQMGTPPRDVVRAKGVLLTEPALPWFVNEEEIPFSGTIVTRSYQRARWYDGRTFVWIGRRRETGRGVGSSDLRFDQIEPVTR
ncbi:hypothetical protein J421_5189 (plasmid) [Gemmatirosa kalamazoonensis]|uniref:Uncharacterized protein n=1 Tax=Gemmatirosa kalamazoonensis TaxID=861299 RepID=W0RP01_9BACT|nr:hypothetical protein [Gemmatirosa kalamazoonensis]AHG92724.1 hypothetical protein J421_5189 [Gemmatirosa kalamazoonensis]